MVPRRSSGAAAETRTICGRQTRKPVKANRWPKGDARRSALRMHRFFRQPPGLENFRVDWICPEAGIRKTVSIKGKTTVTLPDYEAGKAYPDAIRYAFYPIDEHLNDGKGINYRRLKPDVLPTIPRGALLPAGSRFLLVAGRHLLSDRGLTTRVKASLIAAL